MAKQAQSMIADRYGWTTIAARTRCAYESAIAQGPAAQAAAAAAKLSAERVRIVVPEGNLLAS
jgi:glycogen(starch) synthase